MSLEDKAQEIELKQWELNNKPRPAPLRYSPGDAGYGPEFCDECGSDIPRERREHGYSVCVDCKSKQEAKNKHICQKPRLGWLSR